MLAAANDRDVNLREILVSVSLRSKQISKKSIGLGVKTDLDLNLVQPCAGYVYPPNLDFFIFIMKVLTLCIVR